MPVYAYKAMNADAAEVAGEVLADTPRQARDVLRARGLSVERMGERPVQCRATFRQRRRGRRGRVHTASAIRELSVLLGVGIPLTEALQTLCRQCDRGGGPRALRGVLLAVREDVAAGVSLAEAMARQSAWFDELCVSATGVGERTGTLDKALARLADFLEHAGRLRGRVGTALIYPAVVAVVGLGVTIFLMTFVVPGLLGALTEAGRSLPAVTRLVKAASDFLLTYGLLVLAGAAAVGIAVALAARTAPGRRVTHRLVLRLPLVGRLLVKQTVGRICVVMATLLESGVVFTEAVAVTRRTVGNVVFQDALARCEAAVAAGRDVAAALEASAVFPAMVVHMWSVGQQSGEMEGMLLRIAETYRQEVEQSAARLTALLEPAMIVLLALLVGFVALATILPILEASHVA